jgi:hypothetical protein
MVRSLLLIWDTPATDSRNGLLLLSGLHTLKREVIELGATRAAKPARKSKRAGIAGAFKFQIG